MKQATAESDLMAEAVEAWVLQAVVTSRALAGLYRRLGDGRQAAAALAAGQSATERMERMGLQPRLAALTDAFHHAHPDETSAEESGWRQLLCALAGLWAFLVLLEWTGQPTTGLQGQRNATRKALHRALTGFRVAFPETITAAGIRSALQEAGERSICAFQSEMETQPGCVRAAAMEEMGTRLRDALGTIAAEPG